MAGLPWTPADDSALCAEYGHTPTAELAGRLGRTRNAVNLRAKRLGLKAPPGGGPLVVNVGELRSLAAAGLSGVEIADILGVSPSRVHQICRDEGLPLPGPRNRYHRRK